MKLSKLNKAINNFVSNKERGKKLKAKKVRKVLDGLKKKRNKYQKAYSKENSAKAKKKLELQIKVVTAQISKGSKLLKDLDA